MATLNIHAFSDTIMQGLMERLGIAIPQWIVRRRVRVTRKNTAADNNNYEILIEGRDPDNTDIPFTLFKSVQVNSEGKKLKEMKQEPFTFEISKKNSNPISFQLNFFGHYNEIPFDLNYTNVSSIPQEEQFYLFYNPMIGKWRQTTKDDDFPL
jgi:hypothetical protein